MYRVYDNPYKMEERLREAERRLSDLRMGRADLETLIDAEQEVNEMRERVNFAWQDWEVDQEEN